MSSLANAVKRKTHKERSQPGARQKLGLLEKKKDYVQRARDFHRKEKAIKTLQRKAAERNPDEFYFAMEKARTKGGVHEVRTTEANKYSQDELRLMKTQDVKYLSMKERSEASKVQRLQQSLHFIGVPRQNSHTVFVDSEAQAKTFDPVQYFDTPKELLDRSFNRPRTAQLASADAVIGSAPSKKIEKKKYAAYKELSQRQQRRDKVGAVAAKLAYDKVLMGKGRKRKVGRTELAPGGFGVEEGTRVYKWKRQRKT